MRFHRRALAALLAFGVTTLEMTKGNLDAWLRRVRSDGDRPEKSAPGSPADSLQAIIDGLDEEVMIVTPDFRIRQANLTVRRRLGAEVIGQPCFRIHGTQEPCRPPWSECPLGRVIETGQTVRVVHTRGNEGDGERWTEVVAAPVRDDGGHVTEVIEVVRDVSESRRLQRELLRANRELLALNHIGRVLSESLDMKSTLQAVTETLLDAVGAQVSWVRLSDDSRMPVVRASRGLPAEEAEALIEKAKSGVDWHLSVTTLTAKGVVLGEAGVATGSPLDQSRRRLLDAIGAQIAVAVERCRLYEEVQLAGERRGELLRSVIAAQEDERRRIARELHDETGQTLTALRLSLERLALMPAVGGEELKARLAQPLSLCRQADDEVDKLIFDLRPAIIDDLGLVEAIRSHAESRLGSAGIELSFRVAGEEKRLPGEKEVALFRVVQESVTNIIKHAHARKVGIHLQFQKGQLVVGIEDDGCGFDIRASAPKAKHGLGLLGMKERLVLMGGRLTVASRPGAGTSLKAVVPLAEERVRV